MVLWNNNNEKKKKKKKNSKLKLVILVWRLIAIIYTSWYWEPGFSSQS